MKILAALDLSANAQAVLQKAVEAAKQQGGELTLLSVAEDFMDIGDVLDSASVSEKFLEAAGKAVEEAKAQAKALGIQAATAVVQGVSPADSIVNFAEKNGFGLIVLGSRGKKGFEKFLLGSVAAKVVAHAPCSVLVIR